MTPSAALAVPLPSIHARRGTPERSQAVPLLQIFVVTLLVIPSDIVLKPIGAVGYPAALVGAFILGAWVVATVLGFHDPLKRRHPTRVALVLLWAAALISYVVMDRRTLTLEAAASADRYLMQLAVMSGIALVAAECLTSLSDVRRVVRVLAWGGAFCGLVAGLQFWMNLDISPYLRMLPGFSLNFDNSGVISRAALNRVAGTAIHPIELGVVAGMLLPLVIWLAMSDTGSSRRRRWAPAVLIGLAIATSVSRSAILAVVVAVVTLILLMPARQRLAALTAVPFALIAVFMSAPGLISTLSSFFSAGSSDPSVASRVDDYPLVERLVREQPWFGHGGGTYLTDNMLDILDNQYLKTAVELGLIGVLALLVYLLLPVFAALLARRHCQDPELRLLLAALAGAALAAAVCSFTFDSMSFPMFTNLHALIIGLIGACWRLVASSKSAVIHPSRATSHSNRAVQTAGG